MLPEQAQQSRFPVVINTGHIHQPVDNNSDGQGNAPLLHDQESSCHAVGADQSAEKWKVAVYSISSMSNIKKPPRGAHR